MHAENRLETGMDMPTSGSANAPEATPRALAAGLLVGVLLAVANLYVGLTVGFWDSGHITAAVLAYALLSGFSRGHHPRETAFALTVAAAAGAMPAVAGLFGPVPALLQLGGARPPVLLLAAWSTALSALGVLIALLLRRRLIEEEKLPFPSGIATAETVAALHQGGSSSGKARALLAAAVLAAAFAWLRDGKLQLVPGVLALPGVILGTPAAALTLGVGISPLLAGVGALIGLRVSAALLVGALVGWVGLVAPLLRGGLGADAAAAFVAWPAVALLVGAAAVSLARLFGTFAAGARDLASASGSTLLGPPRAALLLAAACTAAVAGLGALLFGLPIQHGLLALAAALPLAALCGRAAGQTDVSPAGQVSQLTQAGFSPLAGGSAALDLGAAAIVSGTSAQTGVTLWSLRAGQLLGSSPRAQALAALIGSLAGAAISGLAYAVLFRPGALPKLPMPSAQQWRAIAELAAAGAAAFPEGAGKAAATGLAAGVILQLLSTTKVGRALPDPTALGIGMLLPVHAAAAAVLGAAASALWQRLRPASQAALGNVVAGGLVAGESVAGLAVAIGQALG